MNGHWWKGALVLAAWVSAACTGGNAPNNGASSGPPVQGGTAVLGVLSDFQAFNPLVSTHLPTDDVGKYMLFTPLVQYDSTLQIQPYLAKSWELSDSGVVFHLRDDVRWHDGQPLTAEDVKFTFDLAKNPQVASLLGSAYLDMVESAQVEDPYTIRFTFRTAHAQPLDAFWWAPVPKHLLSNVEPAALSRAAFNRAPVGSGPFRFVRWDAGQRLTLEANLDFPEALGGRPRLDRVVFRVIPEATTMVTELLSGTVDLITYTLLPEQGMQIKRQQRARLEHFPSKEFAYLGWNNERPPFEDVAVRRAFSHAVNRDAILAALWGGLARPVSNLIYPGSPLYQEVKAPAYDPALAKRLLEEAGWVDRDGDGVREKNGAPLRFSLLTNSENRMRQDLAVVLEAELRKVGARVDIQTVEFQTMLRMHKERSYDAVLSGWIWDNFRVNPSPLFSCAEARKPMSANRAGFCDAELDGLMEQALRETDPVRGRALWTQYMTQLQEEQPITPLFWNEDMAGVGPRLQGVEMDVRGKIAGISAWWIPEAQQRQ